MKAGPVLYNDFDRGASFGVDDVGDKTGDKQTPESLFCRVGEGSGESKFRSVLVGIVTACVWY